MVQAELDGGAQIFLISTHNFRIARNYLKHKIYSTSIRLTK